MAAVSDSQTIAALRFLIGHGGDQLQIIVTSWSRAELPLSKLRIRDDLVEIDCEKMRFDADEAGSLLNDVAGLRLAGADVAALTASTDGWIAALQLATLSLRGGGDASSLLNGMSGEDEAVGEFLAENVSRCPRTRTGRVHAGDIDHRTDLRGAGIGCWPATTARRAYSKTSSDAVCFCGASMTTRSGFATTRCSPDFSGADSSVVARTVCASCTAPRRNGSLNAATSARRSTHALAAGETIRAVEIVEQEQTRALINQSRMATFLGIVDKLPPQLVNSRATLQLAIAWANILLTRRAATDAALDRFAAAISGADLPAARRADLTVEANVVRAVAELHGDRVEALGDLVAEAMSRADTLRAALPQAAAPRLGFRGNQSLRLRGCSTDPGMGGALPRTGRHGWRRLRPLLVWYRRQTTTRHPACAAQVPRGLRDRRLGGATLVCRTTRRGGSRRTAVRNR